MAEAGHSRLKGVGRAVGLILLSLGTSASLAWSCSAISIDAKAGLLTRVALITLLLALSIAACWKIRPLRRALLVPLSLSGVVLLWWLSLAARADRNWAPEYAQLPSGTFEGRELTVRNVRCFNYQSKTEFEELWETREYDLDQLEGVDIFFSHWGSPHVAHTLMSWQFKDAPPLAISIETRREEGEASLPYLGFYRQYELYYVVADESDLVKLRTHHRKEDVYLYRLKADEEDAERLLRDYFDTINKLEEKPRWYNAAAQNCTTTIRYHLRAVDGGGAWNWRLLANGYLPDLCYERGTVNTDVPFETLRERSKITEKAQRLGKGTQFHDGIREGLPTRP